MKKEIRNAYPNELYHYGIKGMKWGVRRYQNPDGSYTKAGKERRRGEIGSTDVDISNESSGEHKTGWFDPTHKPKTQGPSKAQATAVTVKNSIDAIKNIRNTSKTMNPVPISDSITKMSDEELRRAVNRMQLERTYAQMTANERVRKGERRVNSILNYASDIASIGVSVVTLITLMKAARG